MCVDSIAINKITIKYSFLQDDLRSGYHYIRIEPKDE